MEKKYTTDDLILYLFNETPLTQTVLIQKDIDNDPETESEFESLKEALQLSDLLLERPSAKCLAEIMRYSRKKAMPALFG